VTILEEFCDERKEATFQEINKLLKVSRDRFRSTKIRATDAGSTPNHFSTIYPAMFHPSVHRAASRQPGDSALAFLVFIQTLVQMFTYMSVFTQTLVHTITSILCFTQTLVQQLINMLLQTNKINESFQTSNEIKMPEHVVGKIRILFVETGFGYIAAKQKTVFWGDRGQNWRM